jgi:hypothetical protein
MSDPDSDRQEDWELRPDCRRRAGASKTSVQQPLISLQLAIAGVLAQLINHMVQHAN